jgi:sec-independent protein translocase protein TatB
MSVFLDLNFTKLLVLGVIALIVFGPERLPVMAAQAGRALREVRKWLDGAKSELQENLGPEFSQLDLADLNPKRFVRKHLIDEITGDGVIRNAIADVRGAANGTTAAGMALPAGDRPPYDTEAT